MASAVLSGVANLFSMVGYECIAVAGDNYKLRRRFLRLSGFLIFLSGKIDSTNSIFRRFNRIISGICCIL